MLAARACEQLYAGTDRVNAAVSEFRSLIDLGARLGQHVTNFAAVMEQVQQVSQSIDSIAKTTNMLALNAAIEAERAGDAGRTFPVVAAAAKNPAQHTRGPPPTHHPPTPHPPPPHSPPPTPPTTTHPPPPPP